MYKGLINEKTTLLSNAETELKSFFKDYFNLADERIKSAARHGVSDAVNILKRTTWANVAAIPYKMTTPTKKYGVPLIEGVRAYMWKGEATGVVHVLGNDYTNDGTWLLRFFAGRGAFRKNRGTIEGYMSLKAAYNATMASQLGAIKKSIQSAIDEMNK